jgi:Excalibur calcium-binding domain
MRNLVRVSVIVGLAAFAYSRYQAAAHRSSLASQPASQPVEKTSVPSTVEQHASNFSCDGRTYCSQMTSCAEATYFIQHCPGTKMDGNNDGVPCEKQWCR